MAGSHRKENWRVLSMFVGMLASAFWIFVVMIFPSYFSSRGEVMPFDWWVIIAAGLVGAVVFFFGAMWIVRGVERIRGRSGKDRPGS